MNFRKWYARDWSYDYNMSIIRLHEIDAGHICLLLTISDFTHGSLYALFAEIDVIDLGSFGLFTTTPFPVSV